jgi:hypothetical protein
VILRELTGHRRMAADLLIMEALDWDEGELLDEHSPRSGGPTSEVRSTVPGIVTDDVSRTARRRTVCNQPEGTHTRGDEWAVVGPRDSGQQRSTTVPHGQSNLQLVSCNQEDVPTAVEVRWRSRS